MKKRKITLPRVYHPPNGAPPETLAYLNPFEHQLIKQMTDGTASRGPNGVRSYAVTSGTTTSNSYSGSSGGSGGPGGGSLYASARTAPSTGTVGSGNASSGAKSTGTGTAAKAGGSGVTGSKGGGASTQKPGAGQNAGQVSAAGLSQAKSALSDTRSTAIGRVAQAAQNNASKTTSSNYSSATSGSRYGGASTQTPGIGTHTAANGSYYGPKGGAALNTDARMAAARSVGYSQPNVTRTPGDAQMLGRMMMAESGNIRNAFGGVNTSGLQGIADVARNRMLSSQYPNTVSGVLNQRNQFSPMQDGSFARTPANAMATRVAESVLSGESPPVVGNALNYGNLNTINGLRGYPSAATRSAFNAMQPTATIADATNPATRSHTFGTLGNNSDVAFGGIGAYSPQPGTSPAMTQVASTVPGATPNAMASFGINYRPDSWENDVSYLAGRTIAPTTAEAALPGYANPYSAVDPRLITRGATLVRDAEAATGARATINDAYRSYWHQAEGAPPAPGKKASPGNSWHQAGEAFDIAPGPVLNAISANRASLPAAYGLSQPMPSTDPFHVQVAGISRPFEGSKLTSGLRPPGSSTQLASLEGGSIPGGIQVASAATSAAADAARIAKRDQALSVLTGSTTPNYSMGTEVQGPTRYSANLPGIPSPISTAINLGPRYPAGTYTSPYDRMNPKVMTDPRVGMPTGAFPAGRAFSVGPWQGPRLPNDPTVPRSIPSPMLQTQVMTDPRVSMPNGAFPMGARMPMDPRVGMNPGGYPMGQQVSTDPRVSRTPLGGFPMTPKIATDPRVSQVPVGGYPAARAQTVMDPRVGMPTGGYPATPPASVFSDPRVGLTPLGGLPAARPKEPSIAWHGVPPLGGALPPEKATALGVWSTNRTPPSAPNIGTIHSQTAQATPPATSETAPSLWQTPGGLTGFIKAKTGVDVNQVTKQAAAGNKWVAEHPVLAKIAAAVMGGSGPSAGGLRAGMQDHGPGFGTGGSYAPPMMPAPVQQASAPSLDQLQMLQANMMQQGASPEELAYVQSLIDQLSQTQVA